MGTLLQSSAALLEEQFQVYTRAPLILRQQLLFPYVHGLAFVKAALARGGWPELQRVYQHPPVSAQQVMHPEKYFAEPPVLPSEVTLSYPRRRAEHVLAQTQTRCPGRVFSFCHFAAVSP